jgi:hypothetical protein
MPRQPSLPRSDAQQGKKLSHGKKSSTSDSPRKKLVKPLLPRNGNAKSKMRFSQERKVAERERLQMVGNARKRERALRLEARRVGKSGVRVRWKIVRRKSRMMRVRRG